MAAIFAAARRPRRFRPFGRRGMAGTTKGPFVGFLRFSGRGLGLLGRRGSGSERICSSAGRGGSGRSRSCSSCAERHDDASQPSQQNADQTAIEMRFARVIGRRGDAELRGTSNTTDRTEAAMRTREADQSHATVDRRSVMDKLAD